MIDGPIAGDAEDPCRQAPGGVVATLMAPDLVEDPLQDIFGVVVGHEPAQIAKHRRAVSGIDVVDHAVRTSGQSGFETAVSKAKVSKWTAQAVMYRRFGSRKKLRTTSGSFCSRCSAASALALRSSGPLTPARPIRSCLTCFHTHSSGFSSGAYPGRKHSCSRPLVDSANALTALERCTGWPSRTRNTGPGLSSSSRRQKSMNTEPFKWPS